MNKQTTKQSELISPKKQIKIKLKIRTHNKIKKNWISDTNTPQIETKEIYFPKIDREFNNNSSKTLNLEEKIGMGLSQNGEIESQLLLKLIMERRNKLGKVINNYKELPNASKKSLFIAKRNKLYQTKFKTQST